MLPEMNVLKYALLEFALSVQKTSVCKSKRELKEMYFFIFWHSSDFHINYKQLINAVMIFLHVDL